MSTQLSGRTVETGPPVDADVEPHLHDWTPDHPAEDRRTRRRQEMRKRLYEAAMTLFIERGYDSTTMDDIADRADVARGTVFNHFERKVSFLEEWGRLRRDKALAAAGTADETERSGHEALTAYLAELARISELDRSTVVAVMTACVHHVVLVDDPPLGRELARYIANGQGRGEFRTDLDAHQAGELLALGYFSAMTGWIRHEPPAFDLQQRMVDLVEIVRHGLAAPATR